MGSNNDYRIPLDELLKTLESGGYEISIEQVLEIQSVLLSTPVSGMKLEDIKFIITPLIAKNEEDQKDIYRIIDSWISEKNEILTLEAIEEEKQSFWYRLKRNQELFFRLKVIGFVFLVSVAGALYISEYLEISAFEFPFSIKWRSNPRREYIGVGAPTLPTRITTPDTSKQKFIGPDIKPPVEPVLETAERGPPIIPQPYNINLQMSLAFGIPLGVIIAYLIFYERRRRMEMQSKKKLVPGGTDPHGADGDKTGSLQQGVSEQIQQTVLEFPDHNFLIRKGSEFYELKSNLKKPALAEEFRFDIRKSIYQTSRSAGFTSLVFSNPSKERKYLFLIENKYSDAHLTHLFRYLFATISTTKIPVKKYTYATDLTVLQDASGQTVYLEELMNDYSDYHLIILGNCNSLYGEDDLLDNEMIRLFEHWSSRSIITPVPLPDWGILESALQKQKFHIVPAEIEAVRLWSKAITENTIISKGKLEGVVHDQYSLVNADFNSVEGLRAYCNNEILFQILCSLAIYPRLSWEITLILASAIIKNKAHAGNTLIPDYNTFLKISRIPWVSSDSIKETFRLQLLNELTHETEVTAREAIVKLLKEVKPLTPTDSLAFQEFDAQYNINTFFLFAHDQHKYRHYADSKNSIIHYWENVTDWAMKERTDQGQSGLMPMQASGQKMTVEEFVLIERKFEKRNITFYKIVLVTLPAVLLYIFFFIFRPSLVYPDAYRPVSLQVIIRKDECMQKLQYGLIEINGKIDSIPLSDAITADTIPISDIEYDRSITVSVSSRKGISNRIVFTAKDSLVVLSARCIAE